VKLKNLKPLITAHLSQNEMAYFAPKFLDR